MVVELPYRAKFKNSKLFQEKILSSVLNHQQFNLLMFV